MHGCVPKFRRQQFPQGTCRRHAYAPALARCASCPGCGRQPLQHCCMTRPTAWTRGRQPGTSHAAAESPGTWPGALPRQWKACSTLRECQRVARGAQALLREGVAACTRISRAGLAPGGSEDQGGGLSTAHAQLQVPPPVSQVPQPRELLRCSDVLGELTPCVGLRIVACRCFWCSAGRCAFSCGTPMRAQWLARLKSKPSPRKTPSEWASPVNIHALWSTTLACDGFIPAFAGFAECSGVFGALHFAQPRQSHRPGGYLAGPQ